VTCEVVGGISDPMGISVEEMLAVVKGKPPKAFAPEGYLDGTPVWAFYTSKDAVVSNYTMSAEMNVAEARSLRDAEMG
jgi:hypothetical protein